MTFIKIVWLVARWEFMCTVRRVSFVTALISLPVAHFALAALIAFSIRSALDDPLPDLPIAIVDEAQVLDPIPGERAIVLQHADGALDALRRGEVEAVYVLDKEYLGKGKVRSYSAPVKGLTQFGVRMEQRQRASALLRKGLVRESNDRSRRLVEPIASLDSYRVQQGVVTVETPFAILGILAGPFGICFVLALSIFLASGLLQQAMSVELQNRMLEVILSVITPAQLLTGKVIGLSAAGLLQVSVYLLTTAVAMPLAAGTGEVSASTMLWSGAIFLAGYALFATLLAGIGAMVRDAHENTQVASACLLLAAAPFFFLTHVSSNSSSVFARALTWFPPTAPATLLLRMGSDGVGTAERGVALATIVLSAGAVLAVSAFLFKWRMLSGERLVLSRLFAATGDRP